MAREIRQFGRLTLALGLPTGFVRFGKHLGIGWTDHRVVKPFFSERYAHNGRHFWHIGPWCIRTLTPIVRTPVLKAHEQPACAARSAAVTSDPNNATICYRPKGHEGLHRGFIVGGVVQWPVPQATARR